MIKSQKKMYMIYYDISYYAYLVSPLCFVSDTSQLPFFARTPQTPQFEPGLARQMPQQELQRQRVDSGLSGTRIVELVDAPRHDGQVIVIRVLLVLPPKFIGVLLGISRTLGWPHMTFASQC